MPKVSVVKTVSERKLLSLLIIVIGIGIIVVGNNKFGLVSHPNILVMGSKSYRYERADTALSQEKGLSGRTSLADDHAMIFVFEFPSEICFWMKDMKFPLDIIWLNSNKQIIHIEKDLSPNSYPNSYCPESPAKFVIEVNGGHVRADNIKVNDLVDF